MPVEPLFRDDKEFLPLQAADLLAWVSRRDAVGDPHSFGWLWQELTDVRVFPPMRLDREWLQKLRSAPPEERAAVWARIDPKDIVTALRRE